MSMWSKVLNIFRGDRVSREIDEEFQSHIAEAIEQGRDAGEARRAFGSMLQRREASRDIRFIGWLESLRADAVFGWRQLNKRKVTSAAAVLSLALAIGSCTSAFRLIDAMLLRPLPVAGTGRLFVLNRQSGGPGGKPDPYDEWEYPVFRRMRALVKDQAELIAISSASRIDLTYASDEETEKAYQQYVSGWMFGAFGVRPALGRLLTESDDATPGANAYAVLSYDYWMKRFGRDPNVVGRTFRTGNEIYKIIGVAEGPFTGTEPGIVTDIFVPTMMVKYGGIVRSDYQWFWTFVKLNRGVDAAPVRDRLGPVFKAFLAERVKGLTGLPKQVNDQYLNQVLRMDPAATGLSGMQKEYGKSLTVLGVLVARVLLIACANVANLLTAQATARRREMALRVSIGAGRWHLVQLLLVECGWLAFLAAGIGALFAWWSAPLVVSMISTPDNPTRLILPADWRVAGFGLAVALGVTFLFGLGPALRASGVRPASALKGGDHPSARPRIMEALIAVQVAFCFLVLFVAGLFVETNGRLSHQATGFTSERLLTIETLTAEPQPARLWEQVAEHLRAVRGVEAVAMSEWPLMTGENWNGLIGVNGAAPSTVFCYFLNVSPEWREEMKINLLRGRDFRASDSATPGSAIVNQAFAKQYFGDEDPVAKSFEVVSADGGPRTRYQITGLVADARYRNMREPMRPVAFFPLAGKYGRASFIVRTAGSDPVALASILRREVSRARPGFLVSSIRSQAALVEKHTIRERLLARLALFFAVVALLLGGVGLYGVLDYSVLQRRREIGIRMAVGAQAVDIARRVTAEVFAMVVAGGLAGGGLGIASVRYLEALIFEVKATDLTILAVPSTAILAMALLAALPAVIRAVRIDPATILRSE